MTPEIFEGIRPYDDNEMRMAMQKICDPEWHLARQFESVMRFVYPSKSADEVRHILLSKATIHDLQEDVMSEMNRQIIRRTTDGLTTDGWHNIVRGRAALYISNHRDIVLDSSFLQYELVRHGFDTTQITFGINLMQDELLREIGLMNKMFKTDRAGMGSSPKEMYAQTELMSQYIRWCVCQNNESVWMAQRGGRTKDGVDRTDRGIIKMLRMSAPRSRMDRQRAISELTIVPVSVSYEWETCDIEKAIETYDKRHGRPTAPRTDVSQIVSGITQPKGFVHIELCRPIDDNDLASLADLTDKEFDEAVASIIDQRIRSGYKLWTSNKTALQMKCGDRIDSTDIAKHIGEKIEQLKTMAGGRDCDELADILVGIYANPALPH